MLSHAASNVFLVQLPQFIIYKLREVEGTKNETGIRPSGSSDKKAVRLNNALLMSYVID